MEKAKSRSKSKRFKKSTMDLNEYDDNKQDHEEKALELENYIKSCIMLQDPSKSVQTIYNTLQTKFNTKIGEICGLTENNKTQRIGNISITKTSEHYIEP